MPFSPMSVHPFSSTLSKFFRTERHKAVLAVLGMFLISAATAFAAASSFNVLDARERGVTVSGSAKGKLTATYDEAAKKDILELDYAVAQGETVSVWAKNFPAEFATAGMNSSKVSLRGTAEKAAQITVRMDLKGATGVQNIPLKVKGGWISTQEAIDLTKTGAVSEVVFVVSPVAGVASVKDTLGFALEFVKQVPAQKSVVVAPSAVAAKVKTVAAPVAKTVQSAVAPVQKKALSGMDALSAEDALEPSAKNLKTKVVAAAAVVSKPTVAVSPVKVPAAPARSSFGLLDAGEKGVSPAGTAKGTVTFSFDEEAKKDVYDLGYTLPAGSSLTVWTKKFPADLVATQVNTIAFGLRALDPAQLNQISLKAEIKGTGATQVMPLSLKPGWNAVEKTIPWAKIGQLTEVDLVITPKGNAGSVNGTLYLGFDFCNTSFLKKYLFLMKFGAVVLFSFLLAFLAGLLWKMSGSNKGASPESRVGKTLSILSPEKVSVMARLRQDFFYGIVTVLIAGLTLWIYASGMSLVGALVAALLGVVIAEMLKLRFAGKHLDAGEVFQNALLTGLLAAASTKMELLQAPVAWANLLMISGVTAAVTFVIYQLFNASSLGASGKHLKMSTGALIVATPFLFGWLLLLENVTLLQTLVFCLTGGILAAWPAILEFFGRLLVVFAFNEILINALGFAMKGKLLKTLKAHAYLLLVSLCVVVAPSIANLGSAAVVVSWHPVIRAVISILLTMFSFAGLWGEIYLLTGILLDSGKRIAPSEESLWKHTVGGMRKGFAFSGILMAILYLINLIFNTSVAQRVMGSFPIPTGLLLGALVFPFVKTIIETFDGSLPFFERMRYSYRHWTLYLRGALVGYGMAVMITQGFFQKTISERVVFGLIIGLLASGGVSLIRDIVYAMKGQGKVQSWRMYLIDSCLGVFLGSAIAFYLDTPQVSTIVYKFKLYMMSRFTGAEYSTHPYFNNLGHYVQPVLLSKWGQMDLGFCPGGVKLLFTESLDGVIKWSVATWLFAINKVFMQAFFDKDKTPIKFFFSKAGLAQLTELMIYVLRWGLWMSPIIFTFLRMMPTPTWYNQDGAIRTIIATWNNITMSAPAFQAWSLKIFVWILAFDFFRVLIWMDHMGLRVATLVNLSFLGMDKLDEKVAKFIGPAVAQRYIPEGVKRFTTWAPLLIPFYLPRGEQWDYVWNTAEGIQNANRGKGLIPALQSLSLWQMTLLAVAAVVLCTAFSAVIRALHRRAEQKRVKNYELGNREYKVTLKENGEVYSEVIAKESDVSRRSYDLIDPCGRILYLVDTAEKPGSAVRTWPVAGNFPQEYFELSRAERGEDSLKLFNTSNGVRTTIDITLPDQDSTAEIWNVTIENLTDKTRQLKVVPYLEWVLNGWMHDRFHTQYQRLYPEMEYVSAANTILAANKSTKSMGFLACDVAPEGFLTGRVDFIGRARSIWTPRALETMDFLEAKDTPGCPTFDPIGSMLVGMTVNPREAKTMRFMIGFAKKKDQALGLVKKYLNPQPAKSAAPAPAKKRSLLIGHGEIPPGTPQPYYEYKDNGNKLLVRTPYTPRPFDHGMANPVHSVMVTNRGLHTSCNGNSQQNRVTPDWPDTVTREVPSEAIYLYDPDRDQWFSPTHHPINDPNAHNEAEFGVDGTAVFRMSNGTLSTEMTVFVPTEDPMGVYLLTVRNHDDQPRRIRVAPYFQMALAFQPERSGPLGTKYDKALDALFFENPRNIFRNGPAFASMSIPADCYETKRGRFFGSGRGPAHPFFVERGQSDATQLTDSAQVAAFLGVLELPAGGEKTVAIILGQTDSRKNAIELVQKYKNLETVRKTLDETRKWWLGLMGTAQIKTNDPDFNRYQNWLKYQALAERIWARRGFYQTSGAFGFRDQLQDTVNLTWVDPALARKQILLHASQQFIEGDVFHWFFTLTDGRSAFSCRSHASDNLLWIAWGVGEYVRITGDETILDEMTSYVASEFPFAPLPKNKHGWGSLYQRSTRADSVYRHCMRSIDTVLNHRMGRNGLPLMGVGDWNDGLDEIGSAGKGESVWLGFFLYYILKEMLGVIEKKDGVKRRDHYRNKMQALEAALEKTWREDRYLRAIHDDGTEIGVKGSGVWEIDALTAAWSVYTGINFDRSVTIFNTALSVLERGSVILLGWPALREDTKPYLGRSSKYPEGVRENGMYCHGVQWLVRAARLLAEEFEKRGDRAKADEYRATAYRLWRKISPLAHLTPQEIEIYGGQPNKQPADFLTTFESGRMIWNGYTGAAGWMLRQAFEGVAGALVVKNQLVLPKDLDKSRGNLKIEGIFRDISKSPFAGSSR
ncbi:MAG TPA: hypothetical protein PKI45_07635 [Candidatus Omnitrophota bacterium]|nr:hypothetical protein [Candidatus Omnitrophota bacterium]